ncbi:MAG: 2-C-methyl-D-erythritol 2,4-cyclodiphosphate synthase [Phycisphaeraceae bacterium]|nr:2-C-methyl-D-erythritol 2,4-cyclodiphosphate synthase [Phycisphaeraceae bacterium]
MSQKGHAATLSWSDDPPLRIGHGYDVHRLEPCAPAGPGRPFVLGGVLLESATGPVSHSDGDALYHAVTDGLLGALSMPDIGQLFPDDDPRHESADSAVFLREAASRVASAGWQIANIDATVILERPKLSPRKEAMRENISRETGVPVARVNIKGKTHERVDAVGEGRAVEVHVAVLLVRMAAPGRQAEQHLA